MQEEGNSMDETNQAFKEYMEEFKKLSIQEKRDEIMKAIKELIVIFQGFANMDNINLEFLKSKEILDIDKSDTEDDFLEAELVYIENAKNIIGQYLDKKNI